MVGSSSYNGKIENSINSGNIQNIDISTGTLVGNSTNNYIGNIIGINNNGQGVINCLSIEKTILTSYTEQQIKSNLSDKFKKDIADEDGNYKNNGFPILNWQ